MIARFALAVVPTNFVHADRGVRASVQIGGAFVQVPFATFTGVSVRTVTFTWTFTDTAI